METSEELDTRLQLLARSYRDVVGDDRNLDEKVRTLITALAFLAVAGSTLFIFARQKASPADLTFDGRTWNAANFFFAFFLANLIFSLMSAFVALDPRAHRPDFLADQPPAEEASVLYSTEIAKYPDQWKDYAKSDLQSMRRRLVSSYEEDTLQIARRSRNKERRLGDAQGFIFMAMVGLGLMGLVRLPNSTQGTRALLVVLALPLLAWALAPITIFVMQLDGYANALPPADRRVFYGLPLIGTVVLATWTLVRHDNYWIAILGGLTAIFVTTHPTAPVVYSRLKHGRLRPKSEADRPDAAASKTEADTPTQSTTDDPPDAEPKTAPEKLANTNGTKRRRLPWHALWWAGVTATACATMFVPGFDLAVDDPLSVTMSSRSVVYRGSGTSLICAKLSGRPYERRRVRLLHDGVLLKGFPKPVYLGGDGVAVVTLRTSARGTFVFEIRRRDTDATSVRETVPVPSLNAVPAPATTTPAGPAPLVAPVPGTPPGRGFKCPIKQTTRSYYTSP